MDRLNHFIEPISSLDRMASILLRNVELVQNLYLIFRSTDSDPEQVPAVSDHEPEQDNTISSQTYTYEANPTDQMPLTNGNALIAETSAPEVVAAMHEEERREPAEKQQAPVSCP